MEEGPRLSATVDTPCILDEWVPVDKVREYIGQSDDGWDHRRLIQLFGHLFARCFAFPPSAHPDYNRDVTLVDQVVRACGARWCRSQHFPSVDSVRLTDVACLLGRYCTDRAGDVPEGVRHRFIEALEHAVTRLLEGPRVLRVRVNCPYHDVAKEELARNVVDYDVSDIWTEITQGSKEPPGWDASPVWDISNHGFSHYTGTSMHALSTGETAPPAKRLCHESRMCVRDRIFIMWPAGPTSRKPPMDSWAVAGNNPSSRPSEHFHTLFHRSLLELCMPSLSRVPDSSLLCLVCRLVPPPRALAICSQSFPGFLHNALNQTARPRSALTGLRCAATGWWEAAKAAWLQYAADTGMYGEYNAILRTGCLAPDLWRAANERVTFIRPGNPVWAVCHAVHHLVNSCRKLVGEVNRQANELRLPFADDDGFVGVPGMKAYRHDLFLKAYRTCQGVIRFKPPSSHDPRACSLIVPWHHMSRVRAGAPASPRAQPTAPGRTGKDGKRGRSGPVKKKSHRNSDMVWVWFPSALGAGGGHRGRAPRGECRFTAPCPECWDVLEWQGENERDGTFLGFRKHPTGNLLGFGCRSVEMKRLLLHLAVGFAVNLDTQGEGRGALPPAAWWKECEIAQSKALYREWQDAMPWRTASCEKVDATALEPTAGTEQYLGVLGALNSLLKYPGVPRGVRPHSDQGNLPASLYRAAREGLAEPDRDGRPHPGLIDVHVLQCMSFSDEAAQAVWRASGSGDCRVPHGVFGIIPLACPYKSAWGSPSQGGGSLERDDTAGSVKLQWGGTAFDTNRVYVTFSSPRMTTYSSDGTVKHHSGATFSRSAQRGQGRTIQRTNNNRGGVQQLLLSELERHLCAHLSDPVAQHQLTRNVPGVVTVNVNYCVDHHGLTNVARVPGKMVRFTRAVKARKFPGVAMCLLVPITCTTRLRIKNIHMEPAASAGSVGPGSRTVSASLPCNLHKCCSATYPKASHPHTLHSLVSSHRRVIDSVGELDLAIKTAMEYAERANRCPLHFLASRVLACVYTLSGREVTAQPPAGCPVEYTSGCVATGSAPHMPQVTRAFRKWFSPSVCTPLKLCPVDHEPATVETRHGPTDRFGRVGRRSDSVLSGHSTAYRSRKGDFVSALYDCTADPSVGSLARVNGAYAYCTYRHLKRQNLWAAGPEGLETPDVPWDTLEMVCQAWTSTAGLRSTQPQLQAGV